MNFAVICTPQVLPKMFSYYLSLVHDFTPWTIPSVATMVQTLRTKFIDDDRLTVIPLGGASQGIYKIRLSVGPPPEALFCPVKADGEFIDLPLVPEADFYGTKRNTVRAEGTLVTFYQCTDNELELIPNSLFDKNMANHGEVTKATQYQFHHGTTTLNGNRYCVIQPKGKIPDRLSFDHPTAGGSTLIHVSLGFKGKARFCPRCLLTHGGQCEELVAFYAARDVRKALEIQQLMVSDSTLRQADETGLCTDVICMSGGRLGQLTHVLHDAPSVTGASQVIVVGGQNDIVRDNESLEIFEDVITTSLETLEQIMHDRNIAIVQPLLPADSNSLRKKKSVSFHNICQAKSMQPHFTYIEMDSSNIEMDGIHPTQAGTKEFLRVIHKRFNIITNERFMTDKKFYRGGKSIFRYGCLFCPTHRGLDQRLLCQRCSKQYDQDHPPPAPNPPTPAPPASGDPTSRTTGSDSLPGSTGSVADVDVALVKEVEMNEIRKRASTEDPLHQSKKIALTDITTLTTQEYAEVKDDEHD